MISPENSIKAKPATRLWIPKGRILTGKKASAVATHLYMQQAGGWISTEGQPAERITVLSEIQDDGKLNVTAYEGIPERPRRYAAGLCRYKRRLALFNG